MFSRCLPVIIALLAAACDPQIIAIPEDAPALAQPSRPLVLKICDESCGTAPDMASETPDMATPPDLAVPPPPPPPPADTDGDGVADAQDKCPKTPVGAKPDAKRPGCPADVVTLIPVESIAGDVDAVAGYQMGGIDGVFASVLVSGRAYVSDAPTGDTMLGRLVVVADVMLPSNDPRCSAAAGEVKTYVPPSAATGGYTLCVPSQIRDLRVSDGGDIYAVSNLPIATGRLDRTLPGVAQYFTISPMTRKLTVSAAVVGTVKLRGLKLAVEVTSRWSK